MGHLVKVLDEYRAGGLLLDRFVDLVDLPVSAITPRTYRPSGRRLLHERSVALHVRRTDNVNANEDIRSSCLRLPKARVREAG